MRFSMMTALLFSASLALAENAAPPASQPAPAAACPMCQPMSAEMKAKGDMAGMKQDGQTQAMSKEMMLRCQMVMQAAIQPTDPAAILVIKDTLKLSDEQVKKLQSIEDIARRQAQDILSDSQKQQLQSIPRAPQTGADMHQHMMGMMQQSGQGQMCKDCPMMKSMSGSATTQPSGQGSAQPQGHEAPHH